VLTNITKRCIYFLNNNLFYFTAPNDHFLGGINSETIKGRETMMESKDLKDAAREMLAKIPVEIKREVIAKGRWTCESNWMMALVLTSGWDVANKMNLQVGQAVGKAECNGVHKEGE
jgi:hypothetical protein